MIDLNGWVLRPYQQDAHDIAIDYCKNYQGPAIVNAAVNAGKSLIMAALAKHVNSKGGRILILSRQATIIKQNADEAWAVGLKNSVYSASLGTKSLFYPVVYGTEQTVSRALDNEFKDKKWDLLLIDEAHMVSIEDMIKDNQETAYGQIVKHLLAINPKMRIIGYTGTPFRGKTDIIGEFWTKQIFEISTWKLIELGVSAPPIFGFGSDDQHNYDLHEFDKKDQREDYTSRELVAMQRKITADKSKTAAIMEEVIAQAKTRNAVLITCSGKKHCAQVAEFLPKDETVIITEELSQKKKLQAFEDIKTRKTKYILQVGCLTTGFSEPLIDMVVLLRRIGSLTLLVQLIGRGLRTLKQSHIDDGINKSDALVLDYTGTFEALGDFFDDPIINKAMLAKKKQDTNFIECPKCGQHNSEFAVRCIGGADTSDRCDFFFKYNECKKCGTHNAPTAQSCRNCDAIMIDPSKALVNKAYTDAEYKDVINVEWSKTNANDGFWITYNLDNTVYKNGQEFKELAKELIKPFASEPHNRAKWSKFLNDHLNKNWHQNIRKMRGIDEILKNKAMFDIPTKITHRTNDKGFSIIARKEFRSGRIEVSG